MKLNNLVREKFGDDAINTKGEIPYLIAIQSIMLHDQKMAGKAKRNQKIKSFFMKAGAILCLR